MSVRNLSGFTKFSTDLSQRWQVFQDQRNLLLAQENRYGSAPEKIAEDILKSFFDLVLDWPLDCINNQVQFADLVLTHQGIKKLIIEVKRPGLLTWDNQSLIRALDQARRYAEKQRVATIAVSDGNLFYAADIQNGGLVNRIKTQLTDEIVTPNLYWLSVDGIYRPVEQLESLESKVGSDKVIAKVDITDNDSKQSLELLHPKYKVPCRCFGYVGNPLKPATWKLPYRLQDGSPDEKHLPGAIRAVVSNYRGVHNKTIPEKAVPDVLVRLGQAAWEASRMPGQTNKPLPSYQMLYDALYQFDRLGEITNN